MPRTNRVDPWGDLHAVDARGLLTGNRGCLVDAGGEVVRRHGSQLWIACLLEYRGWRSPLAQPGRWTPIFFLDDAVALAAGHRPCGLCRRDAYLAYRDAAGADGAPELNRRLHAERHRPGRGLDRAGDRRIWRAPYADLPDGTVVVHDAAPRLVRGERLLRFTFAGWTDPIRRPAQGDATVLTPPTSVTALRGGYEPLLHPSARQSVPSRRG